MKKQLRATEGVFILTFLITFLVCPGLFAAEETLPSAEEIIAKNIEAMGGKEALNKINNKKTVTIRKIPQINKEFKTTDYSERPNKYYQSVDGEPRFGTNGKIAWRKNPDGVTRLLEGDQLSITLFAAKFKVLTGSDIDTPYKSMKTEGIEQINGKDCYKVVKTGEKDSETTVYYDKNTFMIVKIINYFKGPPQGNNRIEGYCEDYRKVNGILFPFKTVEFLNGQKTEEITYEKIELNIEMPEGIFDIPEEVKAIMNKNETEQRH